MTAANAELLALAERCERATGASYDLEKAIGVAMHGPIVPKPYTASLDAAMGLVPEMWCVEALGQHYDGPNRGKWRCSIYIRNPGLGPKSCTSDPWAAAGPCATPALALCAAALRARAQEQRP